MTTPAPCPALLISAPGSGQGKTTVTAALAYHHRRLGRRVRVFKTGPDFLDPMILERASGHPVYQLDLWMGGLPHCRALLYKAAREADLILVEGVMGLFDGESSSADLARRFGLPVCAVIDASAMAQTFGALAHGLSTYQPGLCLVSVVANRVAGAAHAAMLAASLPHAAPSFGALAYRTDMQLPERHLGLVQAGDIPDLERRLDAAADAIAEAGLDALPPIVDFPAATDPSPPQTLTGVRIAVACDAAFCFLYRANLDLLRALGAQLHFFSPLDDNGLPAADSVYLPGGYPELHLARLARNQAMKQALCRHHAQGKPILAECGGMLYLLQSLGVQDQPPQAMAGLLPGHGQLSDRLVNLGMQTLRLADGELRGHTFHHSQMTTSMTAQAQAEDARPAGRGEFFYQQGQLRASYLHFYFPSNPAVVATWFQP